MAHHYLAPWNWDGTLEHVHEPPPYVAAREAAGRLTSPRAAIIDSQFAKATQKGMLRSTRKASVRVRSSRAASVVSSSTRSASCSALACRPPIFKTATGRVNCCSRCAAAIERVFADPEQQGPKMVTTIATTGGWTMEVVRRCDLRSFVVLPKRWIVEPSFTWISRNRR